MFAQLLRSRGYALGFIIGQIWLTAIGVALASALWSVVSTVTEGIIFLGLLALVAIVLLVADIRFLRLAARLPRDTNRTSVDIGKRMGRRFALVVVIEVVVIAAANILLVVLNRSDLSTAITLLLVGLHFIPLASIFHVPSYLFMGILWVLIVLLTLFLVPSTTLLGSSQTAAWIALPLIGCGIVALGAVAVTLIQVFRTMQANNFKATDALIGTQP